MNTFRRWNLPSAILGLSITVTALLPSSATAQDGDFDGLPDSLELSLAQWFFPILNLHCGSYDGLAYGDRRQLYGLTVSGYTNSSNGRIPFVAHPYNPGNGNDCAEPFQCIEIRYGIAWNWDLGDDIWGGAHRGDSEVYAMLVARKDTDGSDWGVTWEVARNDAGQWRLIKEFMSAHWTAGGESSSFRTQGNYGTSAYQRVWCAEGKHAMYPTQSACNNGGTWSADDCSDNRCDIITEVFLKVQNIGEWFAPLNPYIPYPAQFETLSPSGTYNVWSGSSFGTSTDYRSHLTRGLNWCPTNSFTWCMSDCNFENPDCPAGDFYAGGCLQDCGWGPEQGGILCQHVTEQCY